MTDSLWVRAPFLRLLLPLAAGILCGDALEWTPSVWVLPVLLLILIVCIYKDKRPAGRFLFACAAHLFLLATGWLLADRAWQQTAYDFRDTPSTYRVYLSEVPEERERSLLCRAELLEEYRPDTLLRQTDAPLFLLYLPKDSLTATLRRGDEVLVHTRLMPPRNDGNPDAFDYARYLRRRGGTGTAYVAAGCWQVVGHRSERSLLQVAHDCRERVTDLYRRLGFRGDELAVMAALTVGDKGELDAPLRETYSASGASHVLAISGLHVGMIYLLLYTLLKPLWLRRRRLRPPVIGFALLLLLWAFAFLTGLSPSVVRAVTMCTLVGAASMRGRHPFSLNTLAVTAFLMLLFRPLWLFDVGFQLSFMAVASILLLQPRLQALLAVEHLLLRPVWDLITCSVAAQVGTAPLVMYYFARFSTHFLMTNFCVIPLTTIVLYGAVLLLLLTPLPLLQLPVATVLEALLRVQNHLLRGIGLLPGATIDRIHLSVPDVLLLYLLAWVLVRYARLRTARRLCALLAVAALLLGVRGVEAHRDRPRPSICFYSLRGEPAVHCLTDTDASWWVTTDTLSGADYPPRALMPHWNRLRIALPTRVDRPCDLPSLRFEEGLLCYGGRRVLLLDDLRWRNRTASEPLFVDYLYVSGRYRGTLQEVLTLFSVGTVILDASCPEYRCERLIAECVAHSISYVSLAARGSYTVSF